MMNERQRQRDESNRRIEAAHAATIAAVVVNRCPVCGRTLRRNYSIEGWWQCSQFGADGWRADPTQPPCDWQGFTK